MSAVGFDETVAEGFSSKFFIKKKKDILPGRLLLLFNNEVCIDSSEKIELDSSRNSHLSKWLHGLVSILNFCLNWLQLSATFSSSNFS